jgi:hypothetical protein
MRIEINLNANSSLPKFPSIKNKNLLLAIGMIFFTVGFPSSAYSQKFFKPGNNGAVSCADFCSNKGGDWGRKGTCFKSVVLEAPTNLFVGEERECHLGLGEVGYLGCWCVEVKVVDACSKACNQCKNIQDHGGCGDGQCEPCKKCDECLAGHAKKSVEDAQKKSNLKPRATSGPLPLPVISPCLELKGASPNQDTSAVKKSPSH